MYRKAIAVAALLFAPTIAQADVIVENTGIPGFPGTFNFVGYNSSNVAFGQPVASQFLEFGGRFTTSPPPANQQIFGANTTVTATQNGLSFNVPYSNALPDPNLFNTSIAFNANLLGSWNLSVSNPNYATVSFPTSAIPSTLPAPPFITGVTISGNSSSTTTPTIAWNAPAFNPPTGYNQSTRAFIFDLNNNRQEIFKLTLRQIRPPLRFQLRLICHRQGITVFSFGMTSARQAMLPMAPVRKAFSILHPTQRLNSAAR